MKLTDALLGEHGALYSLMDFVEKTVEESSSTDTIQTAYAALGAVLISHAKIEEEVLFPALTERFGPAGPVAVMKMEHEEIEGSFATIPRISDLNSLKQRIREILEVTRGHFMKEEEVLFHMTAEMLSEDKVLEMGRSWAEIRKVQI